MSEKGYNGWSNYATWGAKLILDNNEDTYLFVQKRIEKIKVQAPIHENVRKGFWKIKDYERFTLADWLSDYTEQLCHDGTLHSIGTSTTAEQMASQMTMAGLAEVEWQEIADSYIEDYE